MAVPKPILLHLKRRPQRTFSQKLIWIKTSFFEKTKVKVHWWWPLTRPLLDILDNYTKWKRILQATSGENCRSKGCAQSYGWLSAKGLAEIWLKIDFLTSEAIQHNAETDCGWMSQQRLCKNQVLSKSVRVMFFFVLVWHGMTCIATRGYSVFFAMWHPVWQIWSATCTTIAEFPSEK